MPKEKRTQLKITLILKNLNICANGYGLDWVFDSEWEES